MSTGIRSSRSKARGTPVDVKPDLLSSATSRRGIRSRSATSGSEEAATKLEDDLESPYVVILVIGRRKLNARRADPRPVGGHQARGGAQGVSRRILWLRKLQAT